MLRLTARRSPRPRIRFALWLGAPLGLLQLLLGWLALTGMLDWLLCVVFGVFLYFLLPAIAGVRAAQLAEEGQTAGGRAGCLVGQISLVVVTIPACGLAVLLLVYAHVQGQQLAILSALGYLYVGVLFIIVFFNVMGAVVGYFGGWLGGTLAGRKVSTSDNGSAGAEEL